MKKIQIIVGLTLSLVFSLSSSAQLTRTDASFSAANGINKKWLEQKIDSLVALVVDKNQPGGAIGVLSGDEVLLKKGYGLSNVEQKSVIDERTIFNIGSVSKHITALGILILEREGKLNLDANIRDYLPQLPDYGEVITVRNLIQHTSGIATSDVLRLIADLPFDRPWSQQDEMKLIMSYPQLNFTPNTMHLYCNSGYTLLAEIIEVVSGMKYSEFLETNLFAPLAMKSSFVHDGPQEELPACAIGYKKENGSFIRFSTNKETTYGAGNILTNLNDLILWGQNMLGSQIGPQDYLDLISNPYNTLTNGDTLTYTYGFYVQNYKGVKLVKHGGGTPGFRSQFLIFPDNQLLLILLFNTESINTSRLAYRISDLLLESKLQEEKPHQRTTIKVDRETLKFLEGSYQMPDGKKLGFILQHDTLWLVLPGEEKFPLFAESPSHFFLKAFDAQCSFVKGNKGLVNEMVWHQGGKDYKGIRTTENIPLSLDKLSQYVGHYLQNNLNIMYPIVLEDNNLFVDTPNSFQTYLGFDKAKLIHIEGDKFLTNELGMLEFTRNQANQINGFVLLDVGRIQNIRFSRQ